MKVADRNKKQKGVVLLTCLVFLLVLLAMLRFVLGSAKLEEEKAGIDLEIVTAREAAQAALNYAEYFIMRQGQLYCEDENCEVAETANFIFSGDNATLLTRDKVYNPGSGGTGWKTQPIKDLVNKGLYTGKYLKDGDTANPQPQSKCAPIWICIDWGTASSTVKRSISKRNSSGVTLLSMPSIVCTECTVASNEKPRFIIERYTVQELADSSFTGLSSSPGTVIFRITAVGFGKGSGKNLTNVMLQSTYVIPN